MTSTCEGVPMPLPSSARSLDTLALSAPVEAVVAARRATL
jgi:hypothetical protein